MVFLLTQCKDNEASKVNPTENEAVHTVQNEQSSKVTFLGLKLGNTADVQISATGSYQTKHNLSYSKSDTYQFKNLKLGGTLQKIILTSTAAFQVFEIKEVSFHEDGVKFSKTDDELITEVGDVVLARKGMDTSYHLSIVVDDAEQDISDVIRGEDLRDATFIHVVLQKILSFKTPNYHHHRLIRDETGKRLAKRDDARAIAKFREDGLSPADIRKLVGLPAPT